MLNRRRKGNKKRASVYLASGDGTKRKLDAGFGYLGVHKLKYSATPRRAYEWARFIKGRDRSKIRASRRKTSSQCGLKARSENNVQVQNLMIANKRGRKKRQA
jgi:hypothetical protein